MTTAVVATATRTKVAPQITTLSDPSSVDALLGIGAGATAEALGTVGSCVDWGDDGFVAAAVGTVVEGVAASAGVIPSGPSRADPAKWYWRSCTAGVSVTMVGERTADTAPSGAVARLSRSSRGPAGRSRRGRRRGPRSCRSSSPIVTSTSAAVAEEREHLDVVTRRAAPWRSFISRVWPPVGTAVDRVGPV